MRQDRFYWADGGEEIDPKRVMIVRGSAGEITGYIVTEQVVYDVEAIIRELSNDRCPTHDCPGCGVPVDDCYGTCIDCARL